MKIVKDVKIHTTHTSRKMCIPLTLTSDILVIFCHTPAYLASLLPPSFALSILPTLSSAPDTQSKLTRKAHHCLPEQGRQLSLELGESQGSYEFTRSGSS